MSGLRPLVVKIGVDFAPSLVYALLGSVVGSVVDSKVAMEHEAAGDMGNGWLKTNSAGSGAYVIKSWTPNDSVVLEANPSYRGGAAALKRVVKNTVEKRLLNSKGRPNFGLNFYCLNAKGEYAGVAMYESTYAVCTENGPQTLKTDALYEGKATD